MFVKFRSQNLTMWLETTTLNIVMQRVLVDALY